MVRVRTVGGTHMCDVATAFPQAFLGSSTRKTAFPAPGKHGMA